MFTSLLTNCSAIKDAVKYLHERNILHRDLKPVSELIVTESLPMSLPLISIQENVGVENSNEKIECRNLESHFD